MITTEIKILLKNSQFHSNFTANSTSFSGFVFNAKEKDYESGFHYYGSRYYSSELSIWNSTDPMADKYPSLTPYNYCANNPIKLIDPNGEEWDDYFNRNGKYLGKDNSSTNLIRIIDNDTWNNNKKSDNTISADIGNEKSKLHSQSNISQKSSLNIYKYYWKKIKSKYGNTKIEQTKGKTNFYMQALTTKTNKTNMNSGKKTITYNRRILINIIDMNQEGYADNYNDVMNIFEHEDRHLYQHSNPQRYSSVNNLEYDALLYQTQKDTFNQCSPKLKDMVKQKLKINEPK